MTDDIDVYEAVRDYIKHEDQLINNRMTWMLTIHGFLYATFGLTIQKILEVTEKTANAIASHICDRAFLETYTQHSSLTELLFETKAFLFCICFVGAGISLSALVSIRAAYKAAEGVETIFERFRKPEDFVAQPPGVPRLRVYQLSGGSCKTIWLPLIAGGGQKQEASTGFFVAKLIPIVLIASWFISCFCIFYWINTDLNYFHKGTAACPSPVKTYSRPLEKPPTSYSKPGSLSAPAWPLPASAPN